MQRKEKAMGLKMTEIPRLDKRARPEYLSCISVSDEVHARVKEVSRKTGYTMRETAEVLLEYAIDDIEWEKP